MPKIIVNGKFDLLHVGHFNLLSFARMMAHDDGELLVAIDSDYRLQCNDGEPIFNHNDRAKHLYALRCKRGRMIDRVAIFNTDDGLCDIIKKFQPDAMVKGSDWFKKKIVGEEILPKIMWYDVEEDGPGSKISSSDIVKQVMNRYNKKI